MNKRLELYGSSYWHNVIQPTSGQTKGLKSVTIYDGSFRFGLLKNRAGKTFASRIGYNLYLSDDSRWTKKYNLSANYCTWSRSIKPPQNENLPCAGKLSVGVRLNQQHNKWKSDFDNLRSNCIPKIIVSDCNKSTHLVIFLLRSTAEKER